MHPLWGALPGSYVPVRVTRGALVAHRYTYGPPRCRTSLFLMTFNPLSVSLWNDLGDPLFDGVELAGFKTKADAFLLVSLAARYLFVSCCFPFLFFHSIGLFWWLGYSD